ncbi:hypothetical protein Droror1_Dr00002926 [Drosera rotundifolia]
MKSRKKEVRSKATECCSVAQLWVVISLLVGSAHEDGLIQSNCIYEELVSNTMQKVDSRMVSHEIFCGGSLGSYDRLVLHSQIEQDHRFGVLTTMLDADAVWARFREVVDGDSIGLS